MIHNVTSKKVVLWTISSLVVVLALSQTASISAVFQRQQVNVCVNFAGSRLTGQNRIRYLSEVQGFFNGIQGVTIRDAANFRGKCDIQVKFANMTPPHNNVLGITNKGTHSITLNVINVLLAGGGSTDRTRRIFAQTTAHEVGHALCAVHDCKGTGRKPLTAGGTRACSGTKPTLMTVGKCVRPQFLGADPILQRMNRVSFTRQSRRQIQKGIRRVTRRGLPAWALTAPFFQAGVLRLVSGRSNFQPIEDQGDMLYQFCQLVSFTYDIVSGDEELFEFGWVNQDNEFVEPLAIEDNADRLLEAEGGTLLNFALRGREGTEFAEQVFRQTEQAEIIFSGFRNPASAALTPDVSDTYFSGVTIDFDMFGQHFSVFLNTSEWGSENGFYMPRSQPG